MKRSDGRQLDQMRPVRMTLDYVAYPEGSVLFEMGNTKVLCNVTIEEGAPRWKQAQGLPGGWVTAEYALLPRSTHTRTSRETRGLKGRTQEIKRLIGRSLRAAVDLEKLGPRTCTIDCDVIQADGGTRTASITGSYVALALALNKLIAKGEIPPNVIISPLAAISVGMIAGTPVLDLCYEEDFAADVDVNIVINAAGELIEVQGTAEGAPFRRADLDSMLNLAESGIAELLVIQQEVLSKR
ncbi:MAG: ribonuclease PH [Chloroflexota bacterium]